MRHVACGDAPRVDLAAALAWLDLVQWPAMAATLLGAWLVASQQPRRRNIGFWVFLVSNALWVVWGWHDGAWALVALQLGLVALNVRGVRKSEPSA
jgi:hypothetical protein